MKLINPRYNKNMEKFDYESAEHAHIRIDELIKDVVLMSKSMEKIADFQEKTAKNNLVIKWVLVGGLGFYVLETIGFLAALGIIQKIV